MKKISFGVAVGLASLAMLMVGCKNNLVETSGSSTDTKDLSPYSSVEVLENYSNSYENIIHYKTLRNIALSVLKSSYSDFGFESSDNLSERPVIIFNATSNLPDYYEFTVLRNGENVGFITTVANKNLGEPIQFISNESKNYEIFENASRFAINEVQIYNNNYPNVIISTNNARFIDSENVTEKNSGNTTCIRDLYIHYLDGMSDEEYEEFGITKAELLASFDKDQVEQNEYYDEIWNAILEEEDEIKNTSDGEIEALYSDLSGGRSCKSTSSGEWEISFVEPWCDYEYNLDNCGNSNGQLYCAPAALGIVLAGYQKTNTSDLTCYCENSVKSLVDNGPAYYFSMNSALKKASNQKLKLGLHLNHGFNHIKNDLKNNEMPVISLRIGTNSIFEAWHYRVILGLAKRTQINTKSKWKLWKVYTKTYYYYLADNNTDTKKSKSTSCPYNISDYNYNFSAFGHKFWEVSGANGSYFQHFPVIKKD